MQLLIDSTVSLVPLFWVCAVFATSGEEALAPHVSVASIISSGGMARGARRGGRCQQQPLKPPAVLQLLLVLVGGVLEQAQHSTPHSRATATIQPAQSPPPRTVVAAAAADSILCLGCGGRR